MLRAIPLCLLLGCTGASVVADMAPCEEPAVRARFPTCVKASDEPSCLAAGGRWGRGGLSPLPSCHCPTGQERCACTRATDCLAGCSAPLGDGGGCEGIGAGRCEAENPNTGCKCTFGPNGTPLAICID